MDIFRWTFDPWAGVRQLRTEMEDVFGRFNRAFGLRRLTPPVNVFQDAEGVTVVAEAPGAKISDLTIEVEGDSLRLKLARGQPEGVKDEQFHRRERATGEFVRELRLPAGLDAEKIEADLANGMLTVRLPKAEAAKPRKIAVKAN
jgi:HSP20 family protein